MVLQSVSMKCNASPGLLPAMLSPKTTNSIVCLTEFCVLWAEYVASWAGYTTHKKKWSGNPCRPGSIGSQGPRHPSHASQPSLAMRQVFMPQQNIRPLNTKLILPGLECGRLDFSHTIGSAEEASMQNNATCNLHVTNIDTVQGNNTPRCARTTILQRALCANRRVKKAQGCVRPQCNATKQRITLDPWALNDIYIYIYIIYST